MPSVAPPIAFNYRNLDRSPATSPDAELIDVYLPPTINALRAQP